MEGRLLLAKPEFCGSILDVQAKIYDLKQVRERERERAGGPVQINPSRSP